MSNVANVKRKLVKTAARLACEKREELDLMKSWHDQIERPDFLWHYLLQSFATMGGARGSNGLIDDKSNYKKLNYHLLARLWPEARALQVELTCAAASIRWPPTKARYILGCYEKIQKLGGLKAANRLLFEQEGRQAKIDFLESFPGIGPKYARNIMMDVYHVDFRDSIAIDIRINKISDGWDLSFDSYEKHEKFYLSVAEKSGLNGWELDRLMFNFTGEFLPKI